MASQINTRRDFLKMMGLGVAAMTTGAQAHAADKADAPTIDSQFFVREDELTLKFRQQGAERCLSFAKRRGSPEGWRRECKAKLTDLLGFSPPASCKARLLRSTACGNVTIEAWVMQVDDSLSIPAYFLSPRGGSQKAVMAIHGHGQAEPCVGSGDDYHHMFALNLAQAGYPVLCPAFRGFGVLANVARQQENYCLDYWSWDRGPQFSLAELKAIYKAFDAEDRISLRVTPNAVHEMENNDLRKFLAG